MIGSHAAESCVRPHPPYAKGLQSLVFSPHLSFIGVTGLAGPVMLSNALSRSHGMRWMSSADGSSYQ